MDLDQDALTAFARKGLTAPPANGINQNGVKVRRVLQLTHDLSRKPLDRLRILDLGCGEGVYAIEAALNGASVLAIDVRTERMNDGIEIARRHGLGNVEFRHADVRSIDRATVGEFDVVYFLGLLYHLAATDAFKVLENVRELCSGFAIIDTHISHSGTAKVHHHGRTYNGHTFREHGSGDAPDTRRARVQASIDNPTSFWFTRSSLVGALGDTGFTSVTECLLPLEHGKASDRITLVAHCGKPVHVSSYPWVNGMLKDELHNAFPRDQTTFVGRAKRAAGRLLRKFRG